MPIGIRIDAYCRPSSGGSLHADVLDYQTRVTAAGGTVSTAALNALNTFVNWCYANGLRDSVGSNHVVSFLWAPATNTFAGCLEKLWYPSGTSSACVNINFVSGDYTLATALTGNGSNKRLETNFVPSSHLAGYSAHMSIYVRTNATTNDGVGSISATSRRYLILPNSGGSTSVQFGSNIFTQSGFTLGLVTANLTGQTSCQLWNRGTLLTTNIDPLTEVMSVQNISVNIFAINRGSGTFTNFSARSIGGLSMGSAIPTNKMSGYNQAWQDLCTGISASRVV